MSDTRCCCSKESVARCAAKRPGERVATWKPWNQALTKNVCKVSHQCGKKRSGNHGRRLDDHFYFHRDVCGLFFAWIHPALVPILRGKCLLCAPLSTESHASKASPMPRIAFLTQTFSLFLLCIFWVQCDMAELWRIVSERADHYLFERTPIRRIIDYLTMTYYVLKQFSDYSIRMCQRGPRCVFHL